MTTSTALSFCQVLELYSVPIGGGTITKLNGPLTSGGDVVEFAISADSSHVVYRANAVNIDDFELFSVPINGGDGFHLNSQLVWAGDVVGFKISPDSSRVIYLADQDTDDKYELYGVFLGNAKGNSSLAPIFFSCKTAVNLEDKIISQFCD